MAMMNTTGARRFSVRPGFTGLRWSRPARSLAPDARTFLRENFVPVAVQTFTGTTAEFWSQWLSDSNLDDLHGLVLVLDSAGMPVAWVASNMRSFGGHRCFYANSAGVHPKYQGSGLSSAIWRELLRSAIVESAPRTLHAVMRTANPLVYSAWSAAAGGRDYTYPTDAGAPSPESITAIAADAARDLGQLEQFDPSTFVIRNAYEHTENGLWKDRPTSNEHSVDAWMADLLGPKDALVLVVVFRPVRILLGEARRMLARTLHLDSRSSGSSSRKRAASRPD